MKANVTSFSLLSQPINISVPLCKQSYPMSILPHCWSWVPFVMLVFISAMISLFAIYFCSEWQFWSMWPAKGVQVLVLEPRNKDCPAGCSNTSVVVAQVNFKEMVGESLTISRQLETGGSLTLGGHHIQQSILGRLHKTWLQQPWDLREPKGSRVAFVSHCYNIGNTSLQSLHFQELVHH